ncbi:hypothetical protein CCR95_00075 [Thiocystis minor]|uniref:hypothetical protein n=1 Tax=Thiocystis minor TaxID=61597 RepID=UPI001912A95A|nr:hypothetical protein [Thiocystis minor]MBK5962549.1 hypothetical protein [Thiocystis minor]
MIPHIRRSPAGPGNVPRRAVLLAAAALIGLPAAAADPIRRDPDTGAATWEVQAQGVTLSITQLLPDQVLAFYVNRGFASDAAAVFAGACVFMTVLRNQAAPGEIDFRLTDWEIRQDGETRRLPALEDWLKQWEQRGVSAPARLAFRWAQLPPEQRYAPGEWNQGMLATGLPPGSRFDLIARWQTAGQTQTGRIDDVRCNE